jgi:hypothetical protein
MPIGESGRMADRLQSCNPMRIAFLLLVSLLVAAVPPVSAQSADPYYTTFSGNYDFVYHELDETSGLGVHFDLASTIKRDVPFLSAVGEVGVNHFDGANVSSFLGGARLRVPNLNARILPFGQVLIGLYHCGPCEINDFALQAGGGVDVKMARSRAFRIRAQIDVRHMFDEFEDFNAVRLAVGVVLPLNR